MTIALDHILIPSRDRNAAAERLASLLGVPWAPARIGPFTAVYVNDGLTIDFDVRPDLANQGWPASAFGANYLPFRPEICFTTRPFVPELVSPSHEPRYSP